MLSVYDISTFELIVHRELESRYQAGLQGIRRGKQSCAGEILSGSLCLFVFLICFLIVMREMSPPSLFEEITSLMALLKLNMAMVLLGV